MLNAKFFFTGLSKLNQKIAFQSFNFSRKALNNNSIKESGPSKVIKLTNSSIGLHKNEVQVSQIEGSTELFDYEEYEQRIENHSKSKQQVLIHKLDDRTIGEKYAFTTDRPLVPKSRPSEILNQKTHLIYKYDSIQLFEALKDIELEQKNIPKFLFLLSAIRRKKEFRHYESQEMVNAIEFISSNLDSIPLSYQVNFLFSLSKLNNFNNDKHLVFKTLNTVMERLTSSSSNDKSIRLLSNFTVALANFNKINQKDFNFDETFHNLEEHIVEILLSFPAELRRKFIDTQSFANIVTSYSKTQNGSEEFYRILADYISYIHISKPQELSTIVYSYANNLNCNENTLLDLSPNIISCLQKCNPNELVTILRAYHKRGLLQEVPEIQQGFLENYCNKFKQANPLDIAHTYNLLAPVYDNQTTKQSTRFFEIVHCQIKNLSFAFEGNEISILLTQSHILHRRDPELFNTLANQVRYLMKKNKMKGKDLDNIHINIKGLSVKEGEYNILKENIEAKLRKLKYYF